jgi:homoprotocatechuate degradation regulator HpaR
MTLLNSRQANASPDDLLLPRNVKRSVPLMLVRARDVVMSRFRPLLTEHGLSEQQWRVIRALAEAEEVDATQVAERACVLPPSVTRIVRTLEARKLVARRIDEGDRRRILLSLTPGGVELMTRLTLAGSARYADFVDRFGAARIDTLLDLLNDLVDFDKK